MPAAYNGHTKPVEILIARGGKVYHLDSIDRTALMFTGALSRRGSKSQDESADGTKMEALAC